MSKRIDEPENGKDARWNSFFRNSCYKQEDDSKSQVMLGIFQMWFEIRATEEEKRIIGKRIHDPKNKGKTLDLLEFEESDLSWKNFYSKKT